MPYLEWQRVWGLAVKHHNPESKERSKMLENSIGVAKWIVRPGWSKEHSNPFRDIGESTKLIRKSGPRKGYNTWEAAAAENLDLETIRVVAISRLKKERIVAILTILGWQFVYFQWSEGIFPIDWMNNVIYSLFTFVSFGFYFKADYQLVMFRNRIIGMTFWQWVRLKLGAK